MKTEPIHIRKGLTLYKQPMTNGGGSPYWYVLVRMKIDGRTPQVKSTGTTDVMAAKRFAEEFYAECLIRSRYGDNPALGLDGLASPDRRFDVVADQWLDQKKVLAGSNARKVRAYNDARKLVVAPNGLGAFFKRTDISTITTDMVRQYLCFAAKGSRKGELATTTQRNHLSTLNGILKSAAERGLIAARPPMPKLRLVDNPRPCFTEIEYRALCLTAGVLARDARHRQDHQAAADWEEMQDFLVFMIATFLRAGEWKQLKQKHCRIIYGDHPYLEIAVLFGKTGPRNVVSMPEAIGVFERIVERDGYDPERLLFKSRYSNRETAKERMDDSFKALVREADLEFDEFDKPRTLYSLRHTSLMFRLLQGDNVDPLMLARNAGTSMEQLERFYLSHARPAMKVANLHSMKPRPPVEIVEEPEKPRSAINLRAALDEPVFEPAE